MGNVREDLVERGIQSSTAYGKTKNRVSLEKHNKGIIVSKLMEEKKSASFITICFSAVFSESCEVTQCVWHGLILLS